MPSPWQLYGDCYMKSDALPLIEAAQRAGLFAVVRRKGLFWAVWTITLDEWRQGVRP